MCGGHAGDDPERDEQTVLGAEHELADTREPPDPGRFAEGVLSQAMCGVRRRRSRHDPGRTLCDLAVMLADGDAIEPKG